MSQDVSYPKCRRRDLSVNDAPHWLTPAHRSRWITSTCPAVALFGLASSASVQWGEEALAGRRPAARHRTSLHGGGRTPLRVSARP